MMHHTEAARIYREGGQRALAAWIYADPDRMEQVRRKNAAFPYMYGAGPNLERVLGRL